MTGTINHRAAQAKSDELLRHAAEARMKRGGAQPKDSGMGGFRFSLVRRGRGALASQS